MERKVAYGLALVGAIGVGAFLALRPHRSVSQENLVSPKDTNALATPTGENSSSRTIVNGMTGAVYLAASDPEGRARQCVSLGNYSDGTNSPLNQQDVTGAAVALGSDPSGYINISGGDVYAPDGTKIGSFTSSALPNPNLLGTEPPMTTVCAN